MPSDRPQRALAIISGVGQGMSFQSAISGLGASWSFRRCLQVPLARPVANPLGHARDGSVQKRQPAKPGGDARRSRASIGLLLRRIPLLAYYRRVFDGSVPGYLHTGIWQQSTVLIGLSVGKNSEKLEKSRIFPVFRRVCGNLKPRLVRFGLHTPPPADSQNPAHSLGLE